MGWLGEWLTTNPYTAHIVSFLAGCVVVAIFLLNYYVPRIAKAKDEKHKAEVDRVVANHSAEIRILKAELEDLRNRFDALVKRYGPFEDEVIRKSLEKAEINIS